MVLRPSLKRAVPGSVPPWRAPCFAWPCRGFGLPGVVSWLCHGFLLPAARNRGAASEAASCSAIARLNFPYYSSCYKNLLVRHAAPADDVIRRHADFLQFSNRSVFLRGFAQSRRRPTRAPSKLDVGPTFCLCFSSGEELGDGSLAACASTLAACCPSPARTAAAARNLLLVAARGCSFHRAPPNSVFQVVPATC